MGPPLNPAIADMDTPPTNKALACFPRPDARFPWRALGVQLGDRPELFSLAPKHPKHTHPMPNIKLSVNLDKVPDSARFQGKKGTYLGLVLIENKEGTDQYGNDGFAKIDVSKEERLRGESGQIVGNWKYLGQGSGSAERPF